MLTHDDVNYLQLVATITSNYTIAKLVATSAELIEILAFVTPAR
jgi:hypothetical protein